MVLDAHMVHKEQLAVSEFPECRHLRASHMKMELLLSPVEKEWKEAQGLLLLKLIKGVAEIQTQFGKFQAACC